MYGMENKKAIVPLADGFEEIEAVTIIDVLRRAGVEVAVAALDGDSLDVEGAHNICVVADMTFDELDPAFTASADALVLPGGMKAMEAFKADERIMGMVRSFHARGKIVAAVCASPVVLHAAGVLKGKNAVCHPSVRAQLADISIPDKRVVRDNNIITATGAGTTMEFALKIVEALTTKETAAELAAKMQVPQV